MEIKLLLVEDADSDIETCEATAKRYSQEKNVTINLEPHKTSSAIFKNFKNLGDFDGAIIDLNLGNQETGNDIIETLERLYCRIPIAILTGTPRHDSEKFPVYVKGEVPLDKIFEYFLDIYNTGLTKIMKGRGLIESHLHQVFQLFMRRNSRLESGMKAWINYGKDNSERTEKALLRHTINHLFQLLDDENNFFPEEVYLSLSSSLSDKIQTGSIVKVKKDNKYYIILNPACDLIIRKTEVKTDRYLLIGIEKENTVFTEAISEIRKTDKKKKKYQEVCKNNHTDYYHWLPKTESFYGGFINFRDIISIKIEDFNQKYKKTNIQISPPFIKDIISRFSSYYSRQGQPNIECKDLIEQKIKNNGCT